MIKLINYSLSTALPVATSTDPQSSFWLFTCNHGKL